MKHMKRGLSWLLVLCMIASMLSLSAFAADETEAAPAEEAAVEESVVETEPAAEAEAEEPAAEEEEVLAVEDEAMLSGTLDTNDFYKMVLIDCGRGYYSVDNIETIIDTMAANDYEYLMLGFGNDGLRFVLNDMSVTVDGTTYDSDTVKNAVISANDTMQNNNGNGQWTEDDMTKILEYASSKNINIIPMLNCPGHAYSICKAMEACGISNSYDNSKGGYNYSVNLSNSTAMAFTEALVKKYIAWFTNKCTFFNLGCDETTNTTKAVTYVNDICAAMPDNMVPMAFCDILKSTSGYPENLVGIDWDGGNLSKTGNYHINANDNWYYVLGTSETSDGWSSYYRSINRTKTIDVTTTIGGEEAYGCLLAVWNDSYLQATDYIDNIQNIIESQATASINSEYFDTSDDPDPTPTPTPETTTKEVTVAVDKTYTDTLTGSQTKTTDSDASIATTATEEKEVAGTWSASASASIGAYTSSYSADNLIDGSTSNWYWSGSAQTTGAYARVDFGTDQTINAIRVSPSSSGSSDNTCTANVQISADGTNWTTVGTYTGTQKVITFDSQTARYAQVVLTASSSTWWQVGEIEWGTATSSGSTEDVYNGQSVTLSQNNYTNYIGYYYKSGNSYYQITNITRTSGGRGSSTYTISYNGISTSVQSNTSITLYTKTSGSATTNFTPCATSGSGESSTGTVVTIKGIAAGDTTAVVGNTTYKITVKPEDVSGVTLTFYPFLSDYPVYPNGTGTSSCGAEQTTNAQTLNATLVNSENGASLTELSENSDSNIWAKGDWLWEGDSVETVLWKGVLHTESTTKQIQSGKVVNSDKSLDGFDFTYIRYYGGTWAVSADRKNWTTFTSSDEICVYYLQQTEITEEVTTYVKDWAFTTADTSSWYSKDHKALSFSVVYPDGQMSPAADSIYSDSTLIYWYDTGAKSDSPTMMIRVGVNDIYKVSKVTWTLGTMTDPTYNAWSKTYSGGSLTWNMTTDADGNSWYDETTCWTNADGDDPAFMTKDFVAGYDVDTGKIIHETYNTANSALLILIYLEPVETEDSLTVRYVDDSSNTEFLNYPLNVTNTSTEEKGTFFNRLMDNDAVIGEQGPWTGKTASDEKYLPDTAYVTNAKGTNETFQKTLTKIPALSGTSYASGLYEYVKAEISEDGKTLTLHYNLKSGVESTDYVVDFGLGIDIPVSDLDVDTTGATVTVGGANYGATAVSGSNITYTPSKVLKGVDVFNVYLKYSNTTVTKTIKVYPATTVYYEEGFASMTGFTGGSKGSGTQTTTKAMKAVENNANYGYDSAYDAYAVSQATSEALGDSAVFTFTGTGVEVYANTTTGSGRLYIQIKDAEGNTVKNMFVNTVMQNGRTDITGQQKVNGYNEPVAAVLGLTPGEYTVTVVHMSFGSEETKPVYLDGFRVFGTLATSATSETNDVYEADLEENPSYVEMRSEVLAECSVKSSDDMKDQVAKVLTGEAAGAVIVNKEESYSIEDAQDLLNNGPKNELYLYPGQTLVFKAETNKTVQLGMKALNDTAVNYSLDGTTKDLNSTTDMFYTIQQAKATEQTHTITNNGKGVLVITLLKVSDDPSFALGQLTEDDFQEALYSLGFEKRPYQNPFQDIHENDWCYDEVIWAGEKGVTTGKDATHFGPQDYCTRAQAVTFIWRAAGEPKAAEGTVNPFVDVTVNDYYYDAVLWAVEQGIVYGVNDTHFAPTRTCNRAEIISFINRWADNATAAEGTENPFKDVAENAYYYDAVLWGVQDGIVYGVDDDVFAPNNYCTRAQIVAFIFRYVTNK